MHAEYSGSLKYVNYMKTSPVVTPYFLIEFYQLLGDNCCLHSRGGKWTTRHRPEGSIGHVHHRKNHSSLTVVHMDNYSLSQYLQTAEFRKLDRVGTHRRIWWP